MKQLEYIITIAAQLVIDGKLTEENAIEMALQLDTDRCLQCVEDMADMNRGYINNEHNTTQKAYHIIMKSVHKKLSK